MQGRPINPKNDLCGVCTKSAGINLSRKKLMGSQLHLPLCQLPFLTSLQLQENLFSGQLPAEIEQCTNLEHLNLGANNFTGPILESIFALQSLQYLNLSLNMFTGGLPGAFGYLQKLQVLDVVASGVNGSIPVELGNLVEMKNLSLSWNSFSPGTVNDYILPSNQFSKSIAHSKLEKHQPVGFAIHHNRHSYNG